MKKFSVLTLALVLAFSLAACGDNADPDNSGGNSTAPSASQGDNTTPNGNGNTHPNDNGKSPSDDITDWPSVLPKLPAGLEVLTHENSETVFDVIIDYEGVTLEQLEAYVADLKAAGYTDIEKEENDMVGENLNFMYFATNPDGYNIELYFYGQFYIQLWKPES